MRLDGKTALITGGARGQGRSHAVTLAEAGADIAVLDICEQLDTVPYEMATEADLEETVAAVEALDRQCIGIRADARDASQMEDAAARTVETLGGIDVLSVNHGISAINTWNEISEADWTDHLDTNLTGVWNAARAVIPNMLERGGGSIVFTSSSAGLIAFPALAPYNAAKHGVLGLMKTLAVELASDSIRVNAVCPGMVNTDMIMNDAVKSAFAGGGEPSEADFRFACETLNLLPVPWLEPKDISNAVLFLASDDARYVTGFAMPVDAGLRSHRRTGRSLKWVAWTGRSH